MMPAETREDEAARQVAELFEQHRNAVYAYVVRLTRDLHLAEEVTQEAFLKVYKARRRLADVENAKAWVFRVATNTCLSALRRRNRWHWLPWEAIDGLRPGVDDIVADMGRRDAVEQALETLDEVYRAPLLLFSYYGFSVAEIAQILEISEGAVRTRVYRAKKSFVRAYQQGESK